MSKLKDAIAEIIRKIEKRSAGAYIDKNGKLVFRISDKWTMLEHEEELVLRHDGVELYRFTHHSGIFYEHPSRVQGISNEEQKEMNN